MGGILDSKISLSIFHSALFGVVPGGLPMVRLLPIEIPNKARARKATHHL